MTRRTWIARTRTASGRFLFAMVALGVGCRPAPPASPVGAAPRLADAVLEQGPISPSGEARAAALFRDARSALDQGDPNTALELATRVVEEYPSAPISGMALLLSAQASLTTGAPLRAEEAAERFAGLLPDDDPRVAEARLVQAEAQRLLGDPTARLERLLLIRPGAPTNVVLRALEDAREAVVEAGPSDLEELLPQARSEAAVGSVVLTRYAAILSATGRGADAEGMAEAALAAGARGTDSLTAVAVLRGESVDVGPLGAAAMRVLTLATVLPTGGSPAFQDFAKSVAEGIEVAAATYLEGATVTLDARDDRGDPSLAAAAVSELEGTGTLGAIGFLEEGALEAAADARSGAMPLISPTARTGRGPGVYTLSGADPQAAVAMARYAARQRYRRVAMIHSRAPSSVEEADAFEAALRSQDVSLVGRFPYDAGTTSFIDQVRGVQEALRGAEIRALGLGPDDTLHVEVLDPVAVFVPVPPEDVELLAPQITHYGLDTLAIHVLGTSGWTDGQTLDFVDDRHTTGVVATAAVDAGPGSPGYAAFREAYERHFRRTLVSPVPALGYDAALVFLEAARSGAGSPAQLRAALERIRGLQGATGTFSVLGGRVVRRTEVVRIEHGTLIPTG